MKLFEFRIDYSRAVTVVATSLSRALEHLIAMDYFEPDTLGCDPGEETNLTLREIPDAEVVTIVFDDSAGAAEALSMPGAVPAGPRLRHAVAAPAKVWAAKDWGAAMAGGVVLGDWEV